MWKSWLFVSIYGVLILTKQIFSQDVEYYPSQASIDSPRSDHLEFTNVLQSVKENSIIQNVLRKFNDNEKVTIINRNSKRAIDPAFHGHPKTREELWNEYFINESSAFDQTPSLIKLIHNITLTYLNDCTPVILYDSQAMLKESFLFQNLLKEFPVSFMHGYINDKNQLQEPSLVRAVQTCLNYIIFLSDVTVSAKVLGKQSDSKVVVVARSSQWAVQEFLSGSQSRNFINLLVIAQAFKEDDVISIEAPFILYTHKLYTDGLGASQPVVIASWSHGKYSRDVNLFPPKMTEGYAGHRFIVAAAHRPPFVFRRVKTDSDGANPRVIWDGIEIRLLKLLEKRNNFSIEVIEPQELNLGPSDAVIKEIVTGRADMGIAGMYLTSERTQDMDVTFSHSQDCAVFITLMSTALPRYRAILGPFHWHVWVALTLTYLFAMFPLAFSDKHTLRHLINNSGEIENMFWYVFGTFTNCFTFLGKNSWSKTNKITTRLLIGWYWIFTIIITSCYTGSIIAFVTLPVFPETVDSIEQLLSGFYRVGTLDRGGWESWFLNSSDSKTNKLMNRLELVPDVQAGIRNTTKAFFWPYAFLGSQAELKYIVQANFTVTKSKRAVLHISNECFVPFGVTIGFPSNSLYTAKLSADIRRILQCGIMDKIADEIRWEMQRTSTGQLLSVAPVTLKITSAEEKGLSLEDTQGMFLLLAAGFLIAATALLSEWMGGFSKKCFRKQNKIPDIVSSTKDFDKTLEAGSEINTVNDETNSLMRFDTRSTSAGSNDTLDGRIINMSEENIEVHEHLDNVTWSSRRSNSFDLDREVNEIFEKDLKRRGVLADFNEIPDKHEKRQSTASNGAFGSHINKTM